MITDNTIENYIKNLNESNMAQAELMWLIHSALQNPMGLKKDLEEAIQEFMDTE
jgi:hypothetical protein